MSAIVEPIVVLGKGHGYDDYSTLCPIFCYGCYDFRGGRGADYQIRRPMAILMCMTLGLYRLVFMMILDVA